MDCAKCSCFLLRTIFFLEANLLNFCPKTIKTSHRSRSVHPCRYLPGFGWLHHPTRWWTSDSFFFLTMWRWMKHGWWFNTSRIETRRLDGFVMLYDCRPWLNTTRMSGEATLTFIAIRGHEVPWEWAQQQACFLTFDIQTSWRARKDDIVKTTLLECSFFRMHSSKNRNTQFGQNGSKWIKMVQNMLLSAVTLDHLKWGGVRQPFSPSCGFPPNLPWRGGLFHGKCEKTLLFVCYSERNNHKLAT